MSRRDIFAAAVTFTAAMLPTAANGASTTSTLPVSATVTPACAISTDPVAFGVYDPLAVVPHDANGNIMITCSAGTASQAVAGLGVSAVATLLGRKMLSGANMLTYNLFTDSQRSVVWGDGTGLSQILSNNGNGTVQVIPIYGRIPAGQLVPPGNYSDTILVTLTY
jgi:spore coat protein U-like protein